MYSAMRGMPEHVMVYREVQPDSFDRHVADLEGALLTDRGYLCTWLGAEPPFDPHFPILIHLVAAQGTPAIYLGAVDPDCHNMLLLGRGLTYRVDRGGPGRGDRPLERARMGRPPDRRGELKRGGHRGERKDAAP
jgi:hypothetical protein